MKELDKPLKSTIRRIVEIPLDALNFVVPKNAPRSVIIGMGFFDIFPLTLSISAARTGALRDIVIAGIAASLNLYMHRIASTISGDWRQNRGKKD